MAFTDFVSKKLISEQNTLQDLLLQLLQISLTTALKLKPRQCTDLTPASHENRGLIQHHICVFRLRHERVLEVIEPRKHYIR